MRLFTAGLMTVLCAWILAASQGPGGTAPPQFRSGVNLVEVDVSVLDKNREPVRGLKASEFTLLEDGRPQPIAAFAEIQVPDPVVPTTSWLRVVASDVRTNDIPRDRRLIVLLLDDAQVRAQFTETARTVARKVIDRLGPGDLTAVVFTRNNRGAQEFTDDRQRLLAAIATFRGGFGAAMGPPPAEPVPGMIGEFLSRGDPKLDYAPTYFYKQSLYGLREIARSLADIPQRRKAVIWVSPGVPIDYSNPESAELRTISETVFREAERANVAIYPIDPSGLAGIDTESPQDAGIGSDPNLRVTTLLREQLMTMAGNTGGIPIVDRNDFTSGVSQILRETGSYYLLGFQPAVVNDGRFRRLEIRVNRPGLTVRARNGYTSAKPEPESPSTSSPLAQAMSGPLPKGDLPMEVAVAPFAVAGRIEAALAITARVRQPAATERSVREVDLIASAFDPQGSPKGSRRQAGRVVLLPSTGDAEFEVLSRIDLKPGRYTLRLAAYDSTLARSGSVYYDIEIPDFTRPGVSLSGLVLSVSPGIPAAPRDALSTLLPVIPTTTRTFTADDDVAWFVRIYQGGKTPIARTQIEIRVLDTAGQAIYSRTDAIEPGRYSVSRDADYRFTLPIERLGPGQYLLTCEASAGSGTARRDVRFTMK